jgi:hypothetical protein
MQLEAIEGLEESWRMNAVLVGRIFAALLDTTCSNGSTRSPVSAVEQSSACTSNVCTGDTQVVA